MLEKIKKYNKILYFIIILITTLFLVMPSANAASFSITSGISSITVGDSYTISISAKGLTGRFNISHSSNVSVNVSSVWIENGVADSTIKVTTKKEGTATVTLTPETVADANGNDVTLSSKTDTVIVKAKSSGGGSSGSGSSSSGSSGESSKPQAPSFTTVNETVYATDSVNVRSSYSTSSSVIGSLEKGESVTRIGKSSSWSKVKYNGQTAYISSSYLTTEKPDESNNKNLKSLTISGDYELTPAFNKDVTEYSLNVASDIDSIDIKAVAEDDNAKVTISGNDKLLMGENTVEVKVTAEDGTTRIYKINVTKGEVESKVLELGLSELTIDGYTLTPEFSTGVYEYKLDISDPSITSININAKSDKENAVIEITGNDELKLGENIVTILVKSEDGKDVVTYQIVVNISEQEEKEEQNQIIAGIDNNELYKYIGIALGTIVIIVIVIILIKRRNKDADDFEPYYGGFDSLNKDSEIKNEVKENDGSKESFEINKDLNSDNSKNNRKSVIEENFGDDINYDNFDDDKPRRKKGKHF